MRTTTKYWYFLLALTLLTSGCAKQYEVTLEKQTSIWEKEFHSSGLPFSGSQLKVTVQGSIDGQAKVTIFRTQAKTESLKSILVGPGDFVVDFQDLEYWGKECFIQYRPDPGIIGSFNVKVTFYGG